MSNDSYDVEKIELDMVMSTEGGRNVINRILDKCKVFSDTYSTDTHEHARMAGKKQVGLSLLDDIEIAAPHHYMSLIKERSKNV